MINSWKILFLRRKNLWEWKFEFQKISLKMKIWIPKTCISNLSFHLLCRCCRFWKGHCWLYCSTEIILHRNYIALLIILHTNYSARKLNCTQIILDRNYIALLIILRTNYNAHKLDCTQILLHSNYIAHKLCCTEIKLHTNYIAHNSIMVARLLHPPLPFQIFLWKLKFSPKTEL